MTTHTWLHYATIMYGNKSCKIGWSHLMTTLFGSESLSPNCCRPKTTCKVDNESPWKIQHLVLTSSHFYPLNVSFVCKILIEIFINCWMFWEIFNSVMRNRSKYLLKVYPRHKFVLFGNFLILLFLLFSPSQSIFFVLQEVKHLFSSSCRFDVQLCP